jgi:hypothetical protein
MALVVFLTIYVFAAMLLAAAVLPDAGGLVQFLYYAVAGLAWVPVAGVIVSWRYARRASAPNG